METHLKALLIALALLALYAVPVAAQDVDRHCPYFESQAAAQQYFRENGGSPTNNVDDLDRNNNGVACEADLTIYGNPATDLKPAGGETPQPTVTVEETPEAAVTPQETPEATVGPVEPTEAPVQATTGVDDKQDEDQPTMPDTGAGALTTGASVPWGSLGLAASGLLAAGYAVIRRR